MRRCIVCKCEISNYVCLMQFWVQQLDVSVFFDWKTNWLFQKHDAQICRGLIQKREWENSTCKKKPCIVKFILFCTSILLKRKVSQKYAAMARNKWLTWLDSFSLFSTDTNRGTNVVPSVKYNLPWEMRMPGSISPWRMHKKFQMFKNIVLIKIRNILLQLQSHNIKLCLYKHQN